MIQIRPDASQQQEPQHAADVFSLRRIDLPAPVLGGAAAAPAPRSARGVAASQTPAVVRTILHVRSVFGLEKMGVCGRLFSGP